jgi:hypothetical protein
MSELVFKYFELPNEKSPSEKTIGFALHQYMRRRKVLVSLEAGARVGYGRDEDGLLENLDKLKSLSLGCWKSAIGIEAFYTAKHDAEDEASIADMVQRAQGMAVSGMSQQAIGNMLGLSSDTPETRKAEEEREMYHPGSHTRYVIPILYAIDGTYERMEGRKWHALRCFEKATLANAEDLRQYPLFVIDDDAAKSDDIYRIKRSLAMGTQRLDLLLEVMPTSTPTKDVNYVFESAWDRLCAIVRTVQDKKPELCQLIGKEIAELDLVKAKHLFLRKYEQYALPLMGDTALAVSKMSDTDAGRVWANALTQYLPVSARSAPAVDFDKWVKEKRAAGIAMAQGQSSDTENNQTDPGKNLVEIDVAAIELIDSGEISLPFF